MTLPPIPLLPGDHLLYSGFDLVDLAIMVKTGSSVAHIEIFIGDGFSVAARNGQTVNKYFTRYHGLSYILRPNGRYDLAAAMEWFQHDAKGLPYAWAELGNFFLPFNVIKCRGMICSVFGAIFDDHAGAPPLNPRWRRGKISPADFLKSPALDWIWTNQKPKTLRL